MKALLIDPSRTYRELLSKIYTDCGFTTVTTNGITDARNALGHDNFQVICTSLSLDDGDSLELCRNIRASHRSADTPIVMLTSSLTDDTCRAAYDAGVTELFSKQDFASFEAYLLSQSMSLKNSDRSAGAILYVEDSASVACLVNAVLTEEGYHVDHFTTAEDAVEALSNKYYDLLLTDVVLEGGGSCLTIVEALKAHASVDKNNMPVLAMSAYDDEDRKLELFQAGINDYVSKPVMQAELLARVRVLVNNRKLLNSLQAKQRQLEQLAMTDQLTSLYNRHYLMDITPKKLRLAKRQKYPISLFVIDVDKFKSINDTHGHAVGDQVLISVAGELSESMRMEDVVARFGGEEFVVLMDNCDHQCALAKAENLRQQIEALKPEGIALTASFGVSTTRNSSDDFHSLFTRADEAVYFSKANGRNQVVSEERISAN